MNAVIYCFASEKRKRLRVPQRHHSRKTAPYAIMYKATKFKPFRSSHRQ